MIPVPRARSVAREVGFGLLLSRAGRAEEAVAALARSGELGFAFTSTLNRDEDLDPIRARSGFAAALERIRRNNAAELDEALRFAFGL